jgi:hypothetical protein
MNVNSVVGHRKFLYFSVSCLFCEHSCTLNCALVGILLKGGGLQLLIRACYSWEIALNVNIDVALDENGKR